MTTRQMDSCSTQEMLWAEVCDAGELLEAVASSRVYRDDSGEPTAYDDDELDGVSDDDYYGIADYVDDAIDVEATYGGAGDYRGAKVYVVVGGPTVYIDTRWYAAVGIWGADEASYSIDSSVVEYLDGYIDELLRRR